MTTTLVSAPPHAKGSGKRPSPSRRSGPGTMAIAVFLGLVGLWLGVGGAWLISLGGSFYYLLAGGGCLIAAWLYLRGSPGAMIAYLAVFVGTCAWAVAEVGLDFWQLVPRCGGPLVIAVVVVLYGLWTRQGGRVLPIAATLLSLVIAAAAIMALCQLPPTAPLEGAASASLSPGVKDDWTSFGGSAGGSRFSPDAQITPANVGALQPAWTYRTGDLPVPGGPGYVFETTPLKIGDTLYLCTAQNIVIALDPDAGTERWRFDPHSNPAGVRLSACRGVSYYEAPAGTTDCPRRIILATRDARLLAVDASTGRRCASFGTNGEISLLNGLGEAPPGFVYPTSPPTIVNGTIVVGDMVLDGYSTDEPSGAIRGYDASTGALRWTWDPGALDENPKPGTALSRSSANAWAVLSADPALGLVYLPMGNATPDFVDAHRSQYDDRYSSGVVALDASTGARRWAFQTTHHDLWDYDNGAQPVLFDMPMPGGGSVPALAQATKHGEIYILDRRDGTPLTEVQERPAPPGAVPGEFYSPTQPYSTGFPSLSPPNLRERDMWGATPLDQLWCRIRFRSLDYSGKFTPPSVRGSLQYPGNYGVIDWGSVSIDEARKLMIVNSSYMPTTVTLIPRKDAPAADILAGHGYYSPQLGTPYAADPQGFLSPLGFPCNAPPWGRLTAIDLATRKVLWQRPLGTTRDTAPLGIALPGAFNIGGSVTTGSGLVFIGATIDQYLRAFDTRSGRELWRGRLPAGGQASPMTYVSARSGRQYVVIAAGGHQLLKTGLGDYVQAFALPDGGQQP